MRLPNPLARLTVGVPAVGDALARLFARTRISFPPSGAAELMLVTTIGQLKRPKDLRLSELRVD